MSGELDAVRESNRRLAAALRAMDPPEPAPATDEPPAAQAPPKALKGTHTPTKPREDELTVDDYDRAVQDSRAGNDPTFRR